MLCVTVVGLLGWAMSPVTEAGHRAEDYWGEFRGPLGSGVAPHAAPPVEWSEEHNIRWKVEVPGQGHSTPIVWGDRVYIQAAIQAEADALKSVGPVAGESGAVSAPDAGDGGRERPGPAGRRRGRRPEAPTWRYQFTVLSYERATGRKVWERVVREEVPHEGNHNDGSLAPATPVADGERIFAYFGSRGLYCLTTDGEVVWEKDLGDMQTRNGFGEGSSPAVHGDTIVVNWDHEGDSYIVALDKITGEQRWRQGRDEPTSWATPLIIADSEPPQVVTSGSNRVRGYDLATGQVLWECGGLGANCIPSPLAGFGHVYAMSGHRDPALLAIRYEGAKGDLTDSGAVSWRLDNGTPYVPSPMLYGDALYFIQKNSGILWCYNARTGAVQFGPERLEELDGGVYASPVGAKDRVYVAGRNGVTYVLRQGPAFDVVAVNRLDDEFSASPAIAGNELYLRGRRFLYCIGSGAEGDSTNSGQRGSGDRVGAASY